MPETWIVLALFRGDVGSEVGDAMRVKERDMWIAFGRPLRASAAVDMVE